jgi:hypothetical protein
MSEASDYVSDIEQEMLEATNFVPEKNYRKRQDYLGALLRAVCDLSDPDFEKLSDEAAQWSSDAVAAHKAGEELPDFENGEDHKSEVHSNNQTDDPEELEAESGNTGGIQEHNEEQDAEPKPAPKKRGRKPGSKGKAKVAKVAKAPKAPSEKKGRVPPRGENQWGIANGTKSDLVCRMLAQEGGTTMKDVVQATGHAHYNLVHRLQRHGHKIVKDGLNIRLISKE